MARPFLPNVDPLIGIGINPKTGLSMKIGEPACKVKGDILIQLRMIDQKDHNNRGVWHNLPPELNSQMIERMLYYRGNLIFFYMKSTGKFMCLPFTMESGQGIDVYGRSIQVTPVAMGSHQVKDGDKIKPWIPGLNFNVRYDVVMPENLEAKDLFDSAVIIYDQTPQYNQQLCIPRAQYIDSLLDQMSDLIPYLHTSLLNATGINGLRVGSGDEYHNVDIAANMVNHAALTGRPWIPVEGQLDFQNFSTNPVGKSEEFLLALQGLDNYRLSTLGLSSGGLFQKKSHMLESEQSMNAGNTGLIFDDTVSQKQHACDIINSIWPLGVWYEPSETVLGVDRNGDMSLQGDDSYGEQPQQQEGGEQTDGE